MNRDDALKKIKKCLAMARSDNPTEAGTAMRQAQKLMAEFDLSEHDVTLADVTEAKAKAATVAANAWEVELANMVAEAFGCEMYCNRQGKYNDAGNFVRHLFYIFVGLHSAAEVAAYAFEVLSRQCAKARLVHIRLQPKNCKPITKTARGDAFAEGWVLAVRGLLQRFAQPEADKALVLIYMQAKHPNMSKADVRNTTAGRKLDYGHRLAGHAAGRKAELNRGVSGLQERKALA